MSGRRTEIIDFIKMIGAADTDQIKRLFYRKRKDGQPIRQADVLAHRDLTTIIKDHAETGISRGESIYSKYLVYYTRKAQLRHKLLLTELYVRLATSSGRILEFEREYSVGNLRADAWLVYEIQERVYPYFVECQISNTPLDVEKYEKLYYSKEWNWPRFPWVVVISQRKTRINSPVKFIFIPLDFKGIEKITEAK